MADTTDRQINIVVCTFNAAAHLPDCLASLGSQKRPGVRVLVMDGGSTDATLEIVKSFSHVVDHHVSEPDGGVYDAMNKALDFISSGWVLYLGADDRLMPHALARVMTVVDDLPPGTQPVIYGDVYRPANNKIYDGVFSRYKILRRNICQQAIFYPADVLKKSPFNIGFKINADHVKNIEFYFDKDVEMRYVPVCVAYYEDVLHGLSRDVGDVDFVARRRRMALNLGGVMPYLFCCMIDLKEYVRRFSLGALRS